MIAGSGQLGDLFDDWDTYQQTIRKLRKFFQYRGLHDSSELSALTVYRAFMKVRSGTEVPPDKVWAFLHGIADNIAREVHAQARRRPAVDIDNVDLTGEAGSPDLPILISEALARLPKGDRELLDMAVWKSTKEIAEQMGISAGNVRLRLHYARKRLREMAAQAPKTAQMLTKARAHDIRS